MNARADISRFAILIFKCCSCLYGALLLDISIESESEHFQRWLSLHEQVWISYAQFEMGVPGDLNIEKTREVYRQAQRTLRDQAEKEERLMLLESWKEFEVSEFPSLC